MPWRGRQLVSPWPALADRPDCRGDGDDSKQNPSGNGFCGWLLVAVPATNEEGFTTMSGNNVHEFNDGNFEESVLKSDKPVLVDFWAPWCGPCKMIAPTIEELAGEMGQDYSVGKMNIDDSPTVPAKYGVSAIPTLMVFKGGEVVQRFTGVTGKAELKKALEGAAV
ncbi:Thioredoxin-1 [Planctomycetes bacterium Pan216]|uniref:Thioredoxin n=1 Tax=Kolteria novifilia TaxID=2527975 RepID=A0A518B200_9BACT|nr:Thioredoxin-1 [Planctomycetes bacterium Pan216]